MSTATSSAASPRAPSTTRNAFIVGLSGPELAHDEAAFLRDRRPCGIIIFSRNFENNAQLRQLISRSREAAGVADLLVLVDQEGGRVQRLRGPEWPDFPDARAFGAFFERHGVRGLETARMASQWLSARLRDVGINTNCVPCLDVPVVGAHAIIGNRAYGENPDTAAALGGAVAQGSMAGGVLPIIKHIPGHGRANLDSHLSLPVVDTPLPELRAQDFAPFKALAALPAAMSAHVTYAAIDPECPASISNKVTAEIIRGEIGFDGLLMSDDVSMQALAGTIAERSRAVIDAGSDVILHCNGKFDEMRAVADAAPTLAGPALRRYERCLEVVHKRPAEVDEAAVHEALQLVREAATA